MAKEIQLSKCFTTIVDDDNYEYLMQWNWQISTHGYATRSSTRKEGALWMHRVILNTPRGLFTDHIDGNRLNNIRENLRVCTARQNRSNMKKHSGKSKFKGVSFHKKANKFRSVICVNYKQHHLGFFVNEVDAALAYDKAAREHFGDFAHPNFCIDFLRQERQTLNPH